MSNEMLLLAQEEASVLAPEEDLLAPEEEVLAPRRSFCSCHRGVACLGCVPAECFFHSL